MVSDLILYYSNGAACAVIALLLFWFERRSLLNIGTVLCVYLLIVSTGSVCIRTLYGTYPAPDPSELLINIAMAMITIMARGRVIWYLKNTQEKRP